MKKLLTGTLGDSMSKQTTDYELVCGLEVHAELKTLSKMFCGCKNDPFHASQPNCYTCPTCLGLPGALPVANQTAIEWTIKLGLALNCQINLFSKFDRKHYFYPDLPKGYQISQYDLPFCVNGYLDTSFGRVRITRIHLEEDTGKLLHTDIDGQKVSLIDFNRSSVPLVEIVTEPDIHSSTQAVEYAKAIRHLIRYLQIGDCDMEQGGMRLEANTSLRPTGQTQLPQYKVELKNINSFRFLQSAIDFEVKRQTDILQNNQVPDQETRGWNSKTHVSFIQRSKEEAEDYRYFPDPDIPPIQFTPNQIDAIKKSLPTLPATMLKNWQTWGVDNRFGEILTENQADATYFNHLFELAFSQNQAVNKLASDIVNHRFVINQKVEPATTLADWINHNQKVDFDIDELIKIIDQVLGENIQEVKRYRAGEVKLMGFFLGQVRRHLPKAVDISQVSSAIAKQLDHEK